MINYYLAYDRHGASYLYRYMDCYYHYYDLWTYKWVRVDYNNLKKVWSRVIDINEDEAFLWIMEHQ